jgi:hypothetical protein
MGNESGSGGGGTYSGSRRGDDFKTRAQKRQEAFLAAAVLGTGYEERPGEYRTLNDKGYSLAELLSGKTLSDQLKTFVKKANKQGRQQQPDHSVDYVDPNLQRLSRDHNKRQDNTKKMRGADGGAGSTPRMPIRQINQRRRGRAINRQEENLTDYLQDYLAEKMATIGGTFDYESALRESEKAIKNAYRRDIQAIRGSSKQARKDSAANRKDVEALYSALSRSYEESAQTSMEQGEQLAGMMQEVTQGSQANLQELASGIANEQASLAEGLGVEEATSAYMPQQALETQEQLAEMGQEGAEDSNRQLGYAGNNQRWMMRGGQNAMLEGTNRQADLLRDLQDYTQGNRDQVANLRSMRGRELAGNKSDIMSQVAEMQAQQDEQLWSQLMDYSGLKRDIENDQFDQSMQTKKYRQGIREGNRDARQWAAEQGLDEAQFGWDQKTDRWDRQAKIREMQLKAMLGGSSSGGSEDSNLPGYLEDFSAHLGQMNPNARQFAQNFVQSKPFRTGEWYDEESKREFKMNPTTAGRLAVETAREAGITNTRQLNLIKLAAMVYAEGGI